MKKGLIRNIDYWQALVEKQEERIKELEKRNERQYKKLNLLEKASGKGD